MNYKRIIFRLLLLLCLCITNTVCATTDNWLTKIDGSADWQQISSVDLIGEHIKFVIEKKNKKIYYVNGKNFDMHLPFVFNVLEHKELNYENHVAYNLNYEKDKPKYILGYLIKNPNKTGWLLSFGDADKILSEDILLSYNMVKKTFYGDSVSFMPVSIQQELEAEKLSAASLLPVIKHTKLNADKEYYAWNVGKADGYLRVINSEVDLGKISQDDIVVLNGIFLDMGIARGVITTKMSSPLSHINIRATSWKIPNSYILDANIKYASLNNKAVHYEVKKDGFTIKEIPPSLIDKGLSLVSKKIKIPLANITKNEILRLSELDVGDSVIYGAKAAHLGELSNISIDKNLSALLDSSHRVSNVGKYQAPGVLEIEVPAGFAIPFFYYVEHIKNNIIDKKIKSLLADPRFINDKHWTNEQLKGIRGDIIAAKLSEQTSKILKDKWEKNLGHHRVFVRSSTNSEDLEGFNGAGLYDTIPNVATDDEYLIAVKKVWASLWNEKAVYARFYNNIPQDKVYPGVIVQNTVDAVSAGVLVNRDVLNDKDDYITINAKYGLGIRVVDGIKMAEQIVYDESNYGIRVIFSSDDDIMIMPDIGGGVKEVKIKPGVRVLNDELVQEIVENYYIIKRVFPKYKYLDIEWVYDGHKVYIVQTRPYIK